MDRKEINKLFRLADKHEASDLHLKVGSPPLLRISGEIRQIEAQPLTGEQMQKLVYDILTDSQIRVFEERGDLDIAYGVPGEMRFRISVYRERGNMSISCRRVNLHVPTFDELHLPSVFGDIALLGQGLVIVAGATGSGKSTTLAAMMGHINENRRCHIITIEDPIEFLYEDKKSFINQREVGIDVGSFAAALKHVVRQDPDVILIGEMRDQETFDIGLSAADTGHLVFGTLHSSNVAQTIGRILELYPAEKHGQIRQSLFFNLRAIICQKLLPARDKKVGRVPALEFMTVNPTIQKLIADGEDSKIADVIRSSKAEGMVDFNRSIGQLIENDYIDRKTGLEATTNKEALTMYLKGISLDDDRKILG